MRLEDAERLSHYVAQLLLVTSVHDGDGLWISAGRSFSVIIDATQDDHITADARALALNNRAANCRDIAIHGSFHNHIAAERNCSLFHGTSNPNRLSETEHRGIRDPVNDTGLRIKRPRRGLRLHRNDPN